MHLNFVLVFTPRIDLFMNTFWVILGLSIIVVALCFLGMAIKIILVKNGRFPEIHIGRNKEMAKRDIHCVNTEDYLARKNYKPIDTTEYTKRKS